MLFDTSPSTLIARLFVLIIAFTVHEFAHAYSADYFGDDTPRLHGRLTLNPLAHLDFMGAILILFAGFGWAKPVPVNPYLLRRHSNAAPMWVALAGPLSNLMLASIGAIPLRLGLVPTFAEASPIIPTMSQFLWEFVILNLVLLLFNMIPLFPLDGEKVAMYLLPPSGQNFLDKIRPYSSMILLGVIFLLPQLGFDLLGFILGPLLRFFLTVLVGI